MKFLLAITALLFSFAAGAETNVCVNMPEGVTAEKISANFDGSVTYSGIKVYADGEMRRVLEQSGFPKESSTGLCLLWKKGVYLTHISEVATAGESLAVVDSSGNYRGRVQSDYSTYALTDVTCK